MRVPKRKRDKEKGQKSKRWKWIGCKLDESEVNEWAESSSSSSRRSYNKKRIILIFQTVTAERTKDRTHDFYNNEKIEECENKKRNKSLCLWVVTKYVKGKEIKNMKTIKYKHLFGFLCILSSSRELKIFRQVRELVPTNLSQFSLFNYMVLYFLLLIKKKKVIRTNRHWMTLAV